ncbi:hypothetical protein HHK36_009692 [Tetracentron sinense]|uniref:Uncharacterized protein n=1 Tax=Tetracentron sinense TaxID=13715 RepID=A0A835DIG2_TETSI|nr:hypothetical protein HHK36_009692 [Tetracentron sinense]
MNICAKEGRVGFLEEKVREEMAMAMMRSGLQAALRRGGRTTPSKRSFASSARHDDEYEMAKWEKITYAGIVTCTVLAFYNLSKGHPHYEEPPVSFFPPPDHLPYPYLHIRNKEFPWDGVEDVVKGVKNDVQDGFEDAVKKGVKNDVQGGVEDVSDPGLAICLELDLNCHAFEETEETEVMLTYVPNFLIGYSCNSWHVMISSQVRMVFLRRNRNTPAIDAQLLEDISEC